MKQKLNRFARVIFPFFLCVLFLVVSAVPAFAVSQTIPAGTYAFDLNLERPYVSFLVNDKFSSGGTDYKGLIFREANPDAFFPYAGLYYIRASDGGEERVCYWIGEETYWVSYEWRVLTYNDKFAVTNAAFLSWFVISAKLVVEVQEDPWGDYTAGQLNGISDKVDQNQSDVGSIEDAYGKLPLPNVNPDNYSISLWLETEYQAFVSCLSVIWENSLIMNVVAILGALLLVSFLVFGSK